MLKVKKILMDYLEHPVGVVNVPQFGWILCSDKKNVVQRTYQLQIAENEVFDNVIYDSGVVNSDESAHVHIPEIVLKSLTKYFVRVQVTNNYGECSHWSEISYFITALCNHEWEGIFITGETKTDIPFSKGTYVRKEFQIESKIKSAYLCSTALGLYKVYLNGEKIGEDELSPGWTSYNKHLLYQTYDVTSYLQKGINAVGAMIGSGWYKSVLGDVASRNIFGERTAFLCQLTILYEDGQICRIVTDKGWKCAYAPIIFSEIYDGEVYDANQEIDGWNLPGVDETNWREVGEVHFDKAVLAAQSGCKVKQMEFLPAKSLFKTPQGDTVIDFGQNMAGWVEFRAQGRRGDIVELNCFEVLDEKGNVYRDNLRAAKQTIKYIFKDDKPVVFHPNFTFQGFRYIKVASYPCEPQLTDFTACVVYSDMKQMGEFTCSNPDINQLQHNILWGLKSNFIDIPSDCPQRDERLGWTGDAQIFSRTACYLMDTYTFFSKWLVDVEADQTPEGGVPHVVPDILSGKVKNNWLLSQGTHSAAGWADVAIIIPWVLYQTYGDKAILRRQYRSMKNWIEFMRIHSKDYIWNYKLQFGDWVALDAQEGSYFGATPNDLTCTAYFAYSTGLFVKILQALDKGKEAEEYKQLYDQIVRKFQDTFFDNEGNMTAQTQTAHIVALYFHLVPEIYKARTIRRLKELLEKENGHLVTGFVGTPYFCHALSENGALKEAYDLLLKDDFPSWLYQVKMGATTIWEHWDSIKPDGTMWSPDMNSFNHYAYGAIGEWLYRVVAGLEIDDAHPGYKNTIIQPHIGGGITYVKASFQSIYGSIVSNWSLKGNLVTLRVNIPANTSADICLHEAKKIISAQSLKFCLIDGIYTTHIGSGFYEISYMI